MNGLKSYNIPFKVASIGIHEYVFSVDNEFFTNFDTPAIEAGDFNVKVIMDKKPSLLDLEFIIEGKIDAPCDRCLADIDIPIAESRRILVKFDDFGKEDTDEVMYIGSEETNLNVGELVYEFISLSIPISKTIDCEANDFQYCDEQVLDKFEMLEQEAEENEAEEKQEKLSVWDQLKDIKLN